jgi:MFS family permease
MFSLKLSDRRYITILLSTAVVFLFADQNLLAPNLSLIANEFHFNDQEKDEKLGANIALGFFIVGGPIALLAGYYADLVNRCILFGAILLLGAFASGKIIFSYEFIFVFKSIYCIIKEQLFS